MHLIIGLQDTNTILREQQEEMDKFTVIVGDFISHLSINRISRQKTSNNMGDLKTTIKQN